MKSLRNSLQVRIALPLPVPLLECGAALIGTETELVLKSRKVYPQRLLDEEFVFEFPDLKNALEDLCQVEAKIN
jgi:NAD dependent epimerase/dehydratase family enzyme